MKKGLLLSIAASAVLFAGGDIQPVEPAAPAPSDFWGQIGFAYQAQDDDWASGWNKKDVAFGDEENNEFSATAVLGVEKELFDGLGFGLELAGWTDFDAKIANKARVMSGDQTSSEVSQAYVTYKYCNTAIKAGRQALPKAVSPWAWSDRSGGVLDWTYEGVVIANTDIADTTLVGAWIKNAVNEDAKVDISDNGLFMLGVINKSFCDTTIALSGYYVPGSKITGISNGYTSSVNGKAAMRRTTSGRLVNDRESDIFSLWGSVEKKFGDYTVGVQGAYVDGDAQYQNRDGGLTDFDATIAVAAKVGADFLCGDLHTELTGWYINNGDYSLKTAGSGVGTSGFWGNRFGGEFNGEAVGLERKGGSVDFTYKLGEGHLFGGVGYEDWGTRTGIGSDTDKQIGGRIGYSTKIMGVDTTVQYRYLDVQAADSAYDSTRQKIRVEAYYKF
jgi:hypothetical protein